MLGSRVGSSRHRATAHTGFLRALSSTSLVFAAAIVLALAATGTSFALWNDQEVIDGARLTSGSTGLSVNGADRFVITDLAASALFPGTSAVSAAPVAMKNTGTTPIAVTMTTSVSRQSNSLASHLTLAVRQAAACTSSTAGQKRLSSFTTAGAPIVLSPGATADVCVEVRMDATAPATVQNGVLDFTIELDGAQVRS